MLQAGAMGVPFVPVRGLYGSDLLAIRGDFKVIEDPYAPRQQVVVAPALRPDVFLTHGAIADRLGNVITVDEGRNDLLAAQASHRVLVSVEELSEEPLTPATRPGWIFIPAFYVDAVVLAPRGAHPTGFAGLYDPDEAHMAEYVRAAGSDEGLAAYLERYVFEVQGPRFLSVSAIV